VVATVKDGNYGFIKCCDRDERLFFHLSAVVDRAQAQALREGSEVRFAIEADREGRSVAAQLEVLPKGSVSFFEVPPPPRETTLREHGARCVETW
jgi:cold shock CspA family protein